MMEKRVLHEFCQMRLGETFEKRLMENRFYRETDQMASEQLDHVMELLQETNYKGEVDKLASDYNASAAAYGMLAYEQGVEDGIHFLLEILSDRYI